jgi:hypothetical protein
MRFGLPLVSATWCLLATTTPALGAATCEASFQKKGNLLKGTTYSAAVTVANLAVDSALGQMRAIATQRNMDILSEDPASLLIEERETKSHKPLPILVGVSQGPEGTLVEMTLKIGKGALGSADGIRKAMCDMLAELKPGAAGARAAADARSNPAAPAPIAMSSRDLATQIKRQSKDSPAVIEARYQGKVFQLTGRVEQILGEKGSYTVFLDNGASATRLGGDYLNAVSILCQMAANKSSYALSLRNGDKVTLTGTFAHFTSMNRSFTLSDCHP